MREEEERGMHSFCYKPGWEVLLSHFLYEVVLKSCHTVCIHCHTVYIH